MNFNTYIEALDYLNLPSDLYNEIIDLNNNHFKTKYHHESLLEHLFECGKQCMLICDKFNIKPEIAFWIGFLHDIGKPFAKKIIDVKKNKPLFTGHAQIGTKLISSFCKHIMNEDELIPLLWSVDNHMCCCSHNACKDTIQKFDDLLLITLPYNYGKKCINFATMLFAADNLSRISSEPVNHTETINNSLKLNDYLIDKLKENNSFIRNFCNKRNISNERVIIINLGLPGSGKSTTSRNLINELSNFNWCHIERDTCYYEIANELGLDLNNKTYEEVYNYVSDKDAKKDVQTRWLTKLNDCLEDTQYNVIIIDSVQPLYNLAWSSTLNNLSEEAKLNYCSSLKIGSYLMPINQLGFKFTSKIGSYSKLPDNGIYFPNVNLEHGEYDPMTIDIGTGFTENISNIVTRYLNTLIIPECTEQYNLIELIQKNNNDLNNVINLFPKDLIKTTSEFKNDSFEIISISYTDGMQIFNGLSRDYRGEVLLKDIKTNNWSLLRGSLPVFPDYSMIEKDPAVFPYIFDILDVCMPNRKSWYQFIQPKKCKYVITYKHDGSLFNLTFIPIISPRYKTLLELFEQMSDSMFINTNIGLLIFGSKSRFTVTNKNPVKIRITNSIIGSYGSIDNFVNKISDYLIYNNLQDEQITMHFEAIDAIPTTELTVFYGKAWCPFLGYTIFTNMNKMFYLPDINEHQLPCNTPMVEFTNWKDILNFVNDNYNKLLDGDNEIEPEGYVVHIFDEINNKWYPIKLKYNFYYVAHKPNSKKNQESAKEILEDSKYEKLRNRLYKFRNKPDLKDLLLSNIELWFSTLDIIDDSVYNSKKDWAIYWTQKRDVLKEYSEIIMKEIKEYYPTIKINLFNTINKIYSPTDKLSVERLVDNIMEQS